MTISTPLDRLKYRSGILADIRQFFYERNVWEVETPLLDISTTTDPYITSLEVPVAGKCLYLQTSPEFAMKRLLAKGSGSIYQMAKVFRSEEMGRLHQTEFTLLEWYRIDFDHYQLMQEVDALLMRVLKTQPADCLTYTAIFKEYVGINPLTASLDTLKSCAHAHGLKNIEPDYPNGVDFWLHLLLSHCIEPFLGTENPLFIIDFPVSQAALAKIKNSHPPVAERFELYFKGIELANGYHELQDATEQMKRFLADNQTRQERGLPQIPVDLRLIEALNQGIPDCAGVALGVDRLVMLALNANSLAEISYC